MAHVNVRIPLCAIVLGCLAAACGGESATTPPPQTATTDQTTTTAASPVNDAPAAEPASPGATTGRYPTEGADPAAHHTDQPMNTTPGLSPSPAAGSSGTALGSSGASSDTASPSFSDGEIVAVVQAADRGEIDQAREAVRKGKNARIKQFAEHMVTDHSAAEAKLASLDSKSGITPQENAVTAQLKSGGEQIMGNLKSASGSDFDKAYIDAQVNEHTQVLDLLDNKLIPHAQNSDLVKTLQEVRTKVANHLKRAQEIQASLGQSK